MVCASDGAKNRENGVRGPASRGGGCALIAVQGGRWGAIISAFVLRFLVRREWCWHLQWQGSVACGCGCVCARCRSAFFFAYSLLANAGELCGWRKFSGECGSGGLGQRRRHLHLNIYLFFFAIKSSRRKEGPCTSTPLVLDDATHIDSMRDTCRADAKSESSGGGNWQRLVSVC